VHEGGNMDINKWIALLSRAILHENRVICGKSLLDAPLGSDNLDNLLMPFLHLLGA
jgi:hypothetical protein